MSLPRPLVVPGVQLPPQTVSCSRTHWRTELRANIEEVGTFTEQEKPQLEALIESRPDHFSKVLCPVPCIPKRWLRYELGQGEPLVPTLRVAKYLATHNLPSATPMHRMTLSLTGRCLLT